MAEKPNDGSPAVDDESDEEKVLLQTKLEEEKTAREVAEQRATKAESDLSSTVEELKELRKKKPEDATRQPTDGNKDVRAEVQAVLAEEKQEQAKANRQAALDRFKNENKKFHPDNDPGGIKFAALEREFAELNTESCQTVEDFLTKLNKANKIIAPAGEDDTEEVKPDASTGREGTAPRSNTPSKLTSKELDLIKKSGWTEERFLALKKAQPDFIRQMLES